MLNRLCRFFQNRGGNVAMMVAMLAVPIVGLAGGAMDFGRLQMVRSRLQDAVDSASVGAVGQNSNAMQLAANMNGDGSIDTGTSDAQKILAANISSMNDITVGTPNVTVVKTGTSVTSTVSVRATMPTVFLGIFGIQSLATSGSASSSNTLPMFIDFYLLLDNTPSMGVGATATDVATMVANTPTSVYGGNGQCAFACHDTTPGATDNFYALAKSLGVTTRIDVLRQATQSLMDTAATIEVAPSQFRMGVYTFGLSADALGFTTVAPPTSDLSQARAQTSAVDLMSVPSQGYHNDEDTDFAGVLSGANTGIPAPGNGTSVAKAQKVLFLVSDGVQDNLYNGSCAGGSLLTNADATQRCISPIDTSICNTIKGRGVRIAVLYTTYLPLPTNGFYNAYVSPFVTTINPTMQACASPGLFFEVSPTQGIADAMKALFQKTVSSAHITQ